MRLNSGVLNQVPTASGGPAEVGDRFLSESKHPRMYATKRQVFNGGPWITSYTRIVVNADESRTVRVTGAAQRTGAGDGALRIYDITTGAPYTPEIVVPGNAVTHYHEVDLTRPPAATGTCNCSWQGHDGGAAGTLPWFGGNFEELLDI